MLKLDPIGYIVDGCTFVITDDSNDFAGYDPGNEILDLDDPANHDALLSKLLFMHQSRSMTADYVIFQSRPPGTIEVSTQKFSGLALAYFGDLVTHIESNEVGRHFIHKTTSDEFPGLPMQEWTDITCSTVMVIGDYAVGMANVYGVLDRFAFDVMYQRFIDDLYLPVAGIETRITAERMHATRSRVESLLAFLEQSGISSTFTANEIFSLVEWEKTI